MNKRFVQFFHELAEENDDLQRKLDYAIDLKESKSEVIIEQKKTIAKLKRKIRELNKQLNTKTTN